MLANGKVARQIESKAFNPTYTFTASMEKFSRGELAAPIIAFGDLDYMTVNRSLVEYFFGKSSKPIKQSSAPISGLISYNRERTFSHKPGVEHAAPNCKPR